MTCPLLTEPLTLIQTHQKRKKNNQASKKGCVTITNDKHCALVLSCLTRTALPACASVLTLLPHTGATRGLVELGGPFSKNAEFLFKSELTCADQARRKDRL